MKIKLTRRQMMMGGAAFGALGLSVGVYGATAGPFDYFKGMLHDLLPGLTIPDSAVQAFTDDALVGRDADFGPKLHALAAGVRVGGFPAVNAIMRGNFGFEKFNREFLTRFLLSSNIFDLPDPRSGVIEYTGYNGYCGNRFAEFEPPA